MSHTDLHAKTENSVKNAYAAKPDTYNKLKVEGPAKPKTPDETQSTEKDPFFQVWQKGWLTRSEIYERQLPDGLTSALVIEGPADSAITFDSTGTLVLMTGERNPERGAGSGRLNVKTHGGQQQHRGRTDLEFNSGEDEAGTSLSVLCYGDYIEESMGSERHIKAEKILISATAEVVIQGGSIKIQSQSDIEMAGTAINSYQINKKEWIFGQKMDFGAGEDTKFNFDPRASVNIVSPGHINWKIVGDYKQWVGGVEEHIIAGNAISVPFVKDRSNSYSVKGLLGNISTTAVVGGIFIDGTAGVDVTAGAGVLVDAVGKVELIAGGEASMTAGAKASIKAGAAVDVIAAANVNIKGALIFLN